MARLQNWVSRLEEYLRDNAAREFEFGEWDCCLFAAGAIAAITGSDPFASFHGQYATREEGRHLLVANGGIATIVLQAGLQEIPLLRAQRGDLLLVEQEDDVPVMGIVALNGREALVIGESGLRAIPIANCQRAWRV